MLKRTWVMGLVSSVLVCAFAVARTDPPGANEREFIAFAVQFNLASIQLGSLAGTRAKDPALKTFGKRLEQAHTVDFRKLAGIAGKMGITAPSALDEAHSSLLRKLKKTRGDEFDHQLLKRVVDDHEAALESFKQQADHGNSSDLQACAKSALPELESHLKQARKLDLSAE